MEKQKVQTDNSPWVTALYCASAALLLFGILTQFLCEAMGYDRQLVQYLMGLIPTLLAAFLVYYAVSRFRDAAKALRFLIALLLVVILLWTVLLGLVLAFFNFGLDYTIPFERTEISPKVDVKFMFENSRMFGKGDEYYIYPEDSADDYLKVVFGEYREHRTLPALSYRYGLWVDFLFAVITAVWCISAAAAFFRVNLWWEKTIYLVCYGILAAQMIIPLLGAVGIITDWSSHPFSANWELNATLVAPQLGIMLALENTSRPRGKENFGQESGEMEQDAKL